MDLLIFFPNFKHPVNLFILLFFMIVINPLKFVFFLQSTKSLFTCIVLALSKIFLFLSQNQIQIIYFIDCPANLIIILGMYLFVNYYYWLEQVNN